MAYLDKPNFSTTSWKVHVEEMEAQNKIDRKSYALKTWLSFACAIFSLIPFTFFLGAIGIVLALKARKEIHTSHERWPRHIYLWRFAWSCLVINVAGLIMYTIIIISLLVSKLI